MALSSVSSAVPPTPQPGVVPPSKPSLPTSQSPTSNGTGQVQTGNSLRFQRYSREQGLSQSAALCILQDRTGFLWIGTEDGLNRFDGYRFSVYRHDPQDPASLSSSHVTSLYEDRSGTLWLGTYGGGLNRFDPELAQFSRYRHDAGNPNSLSDDRVLVVYGDRAGTLWIGTRGGGLNRFEPGTGRWRHYHHDTNDPDSLSHDLVTAIAEDSAGVLWVGTAGGLDRFNSDTQTFAHIQNDPEDPFSLSSNSISSIVEDHAGQIWVGTDRGLNRFERGRGVFRHYPHDPRDPHSLSDNVVTAVLEDLDGTLWIGTESGLDRFDAATQQFVHYANDPAEPYSLSDGSVRAIEPDSSGGLWVGTYGGGISRIDLRQEHWSHYRASPNDPMGLSSNHVWSICEDAAGVLWIGTGGGGLDRFDREHGQWRHYRHEANDPSSLASNTVMAILEDRSGAFWIGTAGGGLDLLDRQTGQFSHHQSQPGDPHSLSSNVVWAMRQDRRGELWIGTANGLNRFDRATGEFIRYLHDPDDPHSLSDNAVTAILEDREGVLWFGTHAGLNRFDRKTDEFTHFQHDPEDPESVSHNVVLSLYEDRTGMMWIGTWGGGLNKYDRQKGTFVQYRVKDGLPNDVVYGILEDEDGNLWVSTNNGLAKLDPQTDSFRGYDARDGLQSNEFSRNAYFESRSGEMFFGGINGFNAFYPARIQDNPYVPPTVLTSITQAGETIAFGRAVEAVTTATFKWPHNGFEFEYAALSYSQPEENQYAYMLQGFDRGWRYVGTRRFGSYTSLPGGTYTLRVKGSNNDGIWNENGVSVKVTVVPPFWETWWFRGALALGLALGALVGYRLRVKSVEARSRALENQVNRRTQELAALHTISGVVSRSLEIDEIMTDALDKTLEVMGIEAGGIYLLHKDTGLLTLAVHKGLDGELVEAIDRLKVGEGFSGEVAERGEPLVVSDLAADPRLTRPAMGRSGFRSVAITPLVARGETIGTLFVTTRRLATFATQEVELLSAIGGQIGVAIKNARFFEAEQRRAEQFQVIAAAGHQIALSSNIDQVLVQIARLVQHMLGYYHVGIGLIEDGEVVYRVGAGALWDSPEFEFRPAHLKVGEQGISGWVAATGEPLLVPDVRQEPRYVLMKGSRTRSEMTVPILVKGQVVGVLDAQSERPNAFDQTDLAVLQTLAHQAGAAIENAQLYEQAQQAAVLHERQRLARELHDAVTQTLFSASLIAEALPDLWEADPVEGRALLWELRQLSRGALAEMRTLLLELRPAALMESNLSDLLRQLAEAVAGRTGLPVTVRVEGRPSLPPEVHVAFYRIAQEALNNVVKHANAAKVTIYLRCSSPATREHVEIQQEAELRVSDDGCGFVLAAVPPDRLGLEIIRERANAIDARLAIDSQVGHGTTLTLLWGPKESQGRRER